jgi:intracellular multiplication protein IcmL
MKMIDPLKRIFERNSFYRRQYLLVLLALILALVTMIVLIGVWWYIVNYPRNAFYFAVDNTGHLLEDIPINQPNMSEKEMLDWVVQAIEAVNSYDYISYRAQLQEARKYFNDYGWINFKDSFEASNNLIAIIQRKMISIAHVIGEPRITRKGLIYGALAYRLQMRLLITYWSAPYDDKHKYSNSLEVNVVVQRTPILQSYEGLSIVQLIEASAALSNQPQEISNIPTG